MMTSLSRRFARHRQCFMRCLLVFSLVCFSATSAATSIKVWGAPDAALQALRLTQPDLQWVSDSAATPADVQLHIAWQQDAYRHALASSSRAPILVLSQQALVTGRLRSQDSALIWGAPLAQQVQLVRRLMPLAKRIGVLYREALRSDDALLLTSAASTSTGVQIVPLPVEAPLTARVIAEAAEQVDVLIASNDDSLFNRDTAKLVLLTAYRHQRVVVGPTPAFVSAGAVATQAVPKAALIAAIKARVLHWQGTGHLGESQAITRFAPVINSQVARSLGVVVPPDILREAQP